VSEQHTAQTHAFRISLRKLNLLAKQISGKPIDFAIMQMKFSEKRASRIVEEMLRKAKDNAIHRKHMIGPKLLVCESL
jgi:large subunit ribosomal protein L22